MKNIRFFGKRVQKLITLFTSSTLVVTLAFVVPLFSLYYWGSGLIHSDSRKLIKVEAATITKQSVNPFNEPVISITFDDGWESVYANAYPLLVKYNLPSTQYLIASEFSNPIYLSVTQAADMQKHGQEIASHTLTHADLVELSDANLDKELKDSRDILSANFGPIKDFATPEGHYDDRVLSAIKTYYRSHRNTNADPKVMNDLDYNTAKNFNPYNIIAYAVRATTTVSDIQAFIQAAQKDNAWVVLVYHQVENSDDYYNVKPAVFDKQLKAIKTSGIKTVTVGQFMDAWELSHEK